MDSDCPHLRLRAIELYERPVQFTKPFRFGAVTVEAAPQAFVRALVEVEGVGEAWGGTAEMMMPKWFDKNPARSPAETVDGLRHSLRSARDAYLANQGFDSAFGHHAAAYGAQVQACRAAGLPDLTAAYGPALIDKAVLDGLLRVLGTDFFTGMAANVAGLDARLTPDLAGFDLDGFLGGLKPLGAVAIRHTVGLLDDPEDLRGLLARERLSRFKIKLGGDVAEDVERLKAIARVLDTAEGYRATLDGNEQYADAAALAGLMEAMERDPALAVFRQHLLYVEQPIARERALGEPLGCLAKRIPLIIDESDDGYDAFPRAREVGYRGVSSKSCKGLYKALLNRARCTAWGAPHFISAEDLTCQAGVAVQQDTALVALLGIGHAERNGHQYVNGFDGMPEGEDFLKAHPGFYTGEGGTVRLATAGGSLPTATLAVPGFASAAQPTWDRLDHLQQPEHQAS